MSKRSNNKVRPKQQEKFQGVPPRRSSVRDIIMFGARNLEEQRKLERYRRDSQRLAEELAPAVPPSAAKRYLSEAAKIASLDPGQLWFFLHNREQLEAIEGLAKLRRLVNDFLTGRRSLPVRGPAKPAPALPSPDPAPDTARNPKSPDAARRESGGPKLPGEKKPVARRPKRKPKRKAAAKIPRVWSGNSRKPGSHRGPY